MGEETALVQSALDRFNAGDKPALNDLFARAQRRMERIAHSMLRHDRTKTKEQTGDVTQVASLRLWEALDKTVALEKAKVKILTAAEFFRLSSRIMRRVLIDLARRHWGKEGSAANQIPVPVEIAAPGAHEPSANAPDVLAAWGKLHERIEKLPEKLREVFDLLWYQELSQAEAAIVLGVSVPNVKRRWHDAKIALIDVLGDNFPGLD